MSQKILKIFEDLVYNQRCFCCDKFFYRLQIHHMDMNHNNNILSNLLIICKECHLLIHNKKDIDGDRPTKRRFIINKCRNYLIDKIKEKGLYTTVPVSGHGGVNTQGMARKGSGDERN